MSLLARCFPSTLVLLFAGLACEGGGGSELARGDAGSDPGGAASGQGGATGSGTAGAQLSGGSPVDGGAFAAGGEPTGGGAGGANPPPLTSQTHRRVLSPRTPMYLVHVSFNVGDSPQAVIDSIPEDVRPYIVLNLNPAGTELGTDEGYLLMREWLAQANERDVWAMVQPSAGTRNRMDDVDTTHYESLYADFPNMIGYTWSEQTWGFDATSFAERLNLLSDLVEMSAKYGGYVYVNDAMSISNAAWNTISKFASHERFKNTCAKHEAHVIYGNKTTHGWGYYDNESMTLGAFLGGLAGHYAIRYDQYSWGWSGRGRLFGREGTREEMEAFGSLSWFTSPEALMGTHITEHLLLSGASVIDGPEVEWASAVFRGVRTPNFDNVMLDVLRRVIEGTVTIPTRAQVAERTKFALVSDGGSLNTPADLFTGLYKLDADGERKENKSWLKKTGRYPTIPFIHGDPAELDAYALLLPQSKYAATWPNQSAKLAALNALFPAESTGDLFIGRLGNNWLAYHPLQNTNVQASGEFELKYNGCASLAMTFGPHTFGVVKEAAGSLVVYLNNYRTDKEPLWTQYPTGFNSSTLQNKVLPSFVENPTDSALRDSKLTLRGCDGEPSFTVTDTGAHPSSQVAEERESGALTLTIAHNGPLTLQLRAAGSHSDRLPAPADEPVRAPAPPSASGW